MRALMNPWAIAVLAAGVLGLVFVLCGGIGLVVAHARRRKLRWGRGARLAVGFGGFGLTLLVLVLPSAASWLVYMLEKGKVAEALAHAAPEQKAALLARSVEAAWAVTLAAGISELVLVIPCAVLAGLALTVPFFLREPGGGS